MKRGSSGLSLVVGVDKPLQMSSHDVVGKARGIFNERRVGHTGTLDPLATGVLVLCIGSATRLSPHLQALDKSYRFRMAFGASTDTDDAAGTVVQTGVPPAKAYDPVFAQAFVSHLVGKYQQRPPAYSAIKVDGQRAYKAARAGEELDLAPREVEVFSARLAGIDGESPAQPVWDIEVAVSKGTYIRALARDIGEALGCPSHVVALARTRLGVLALESCVSLAQLEQEKEKAALDPVALLGYPVVEVDGRERADAANGKPLAGTGVCSSDGEEVSVVSGGRLIGLYCYDARARLLMPSCVFPKGVSRG